MRGAICQRQLRAGDLMFRRFETATVSNAVAGTTRSDGRLRPVALTLM